MRPSTYLDRYVAQKNKRHSPLSTFMKRNLQRLLWGRALSYQVELPVRTCTRRLSALVCYPNAHSNLRRMTDFVRISEGVYAFEVRSRHHLGRGAYFLLAHIEGTMVYDEALEHTTIDGTLTVGLFYLVAIIMMTLATLLSWLIVLENSGLFTFVVANDGDVHQPLVVYL
jgi:hypothetical protein